MIQIIRGSSKEQEVRGHGCPVRGLATVPPMKFLVSVTGHLG